MTAATVPAEARPRRPSPMKLQPFLLQVPLIGTSIIMLYPILIMVFSAFKETGEIYDRPFAIPDFTNLVNFGKIITQTNFLVYLTNSFIVTGGWSISGPFGSMRRRTTIFSIAKVLPVPAEASKK